MEDKRINVSNEAANSLALTELTPQMDNSSKEILMNKEFLALILKHTVKEFKGMTSEEIVGCIETDSIIRSKDLAPGRTNQNRIEGLKGEFAVLSEMMSQFDIYFKVINPKASNEDVACYIYIDIEPQNDYSPGYPIEKRGIYYLARMMSSQVAAPTATTNYSGLEKVYTIWICCDNIPKGIHNTMSVYEMANTWNSKYINTNPDSYDLMTMVILRLGNPKEDEQDEIFEILNALFYARNEKSYEKLEKYVSFDDVSSQEVKQVTGTGMRVYNLGVKDRNTIINNLNRYLLENNLMDEFAKSVYDNEYQNELIEKYNITDEEPVESEEEIKQSTS